MLFRRNILGLVGLYRRLLYAVSETARHVRRRVFQQNEIRAVFLIFSSALPRCLHGSTRQNTRTLLLKLCRSNPRGLGEHVENAVGDAVPVVC